MGHRRLGRSSSGIRLPPPQLCAEGPASPPPRGMRSWVTDMLGCGNKMPQTGWLLTTQIAPRTAPEARSPKSRSLGAMPPESHRGGPLLPRPLLASPTLRLRPSAHGLLPSVSGPVLSSDRRRSPDAGPAPLWRALAFPHHVCTPHVQTGRRPRAREPGRGHVDTWAHESAQQRSTLAVEGGHAPALVPRPCPLPP